MVSGTDPFSFYIKVIVGSEVKDVYFANKTGGYEYYVENIKYTNYLDFASALMPLFGEMIRIEESVVNGVNIFMVLPLS